MLRLALVLTVLLIPSAAAQDYVPAAERDAAFQGSDGTELVMVYFGATHCGPCHAPEIKAAVEAAKVALAERAEADGKTFSAVGAALDYGVADGVAFLASSGRFDEIVVGRNWINSASLTHLWRADRPEGSTIGLPSVVVFEQDLATRDGISASAPRYVAEITGADAIPAWVAAGLPLE